MALPVGITTCTLTGGSVLDLAGAGLDITLTVQPVFGAGLTALVWSATGADLTNDPLSATATAGSQASVVVPHVNQSGFLDQSGAAYTMWAYTVTLKSGRATIWTKSVQPLVGQSTIDLDMVASGSVTAPVSAPFPTVLSVNGMTGAVVIPGGGGGGGGSVDSVNGIAPVSGNVTLLIDNIPDVTTVGSNLAKATSQANARTALGLGNIATHATTEFDASGAATTAQANAIAASAQRASNLSDLVNTTTARTNIGALSSSDASVTNARKPVAANWTSGTAYVTNELAVRVSDNAIIRRISAGTSRSTYDGTEAALWTALTAPPVSFTYADLPAGVTLTLPVTGTGAPTTRTDLSIRWIGGTTPPAIVTTRTLNAVGMLQQDLTATPKIVGDSWDAV